MSSHSRGDDPGMVMEKRRSWMVSEASGRREGGRTLSLSLCLSLSNTSLFCLFVRATEDTVVNHVFVVLQ